MRAFVASMLIAGVIADADAQDAKPEIDAALVSMIESRIVMPKGAQPLAAYQRFYAVTEIENTPVVRGVFVAGASAQLVKRYADPVPGASGAHAMRSGRNVPTIMGGGCSVVETVFYLEAMVLWTADVEKPGVPTPTAFCHAEG